MGRETPRGRLYPLILADLDYLRANVKPFHACLDIGSRNVNGSVRDVLHGGEIIGVDMARQRGYVDILCDAQFLPFRDRAFDCVVCFSVIEHSANALRVFTEAIRVSSGQVYFSIPMMGFPFHEYPIDRWRVNSCVDSEGYPVIHIGTL